MFPSKIFVFVVLTLFIKSSLSLENELCEFTPWVTPEGELVETIENVGNVEACCTHCNRSTPCTAYSYNRQGQGCQLWNHTHFVETPNSQVTSGIVLPPGFVTEIVPSTTIPVDPCPIDNTDPNMKFPHKTDCSKFYVCLLGNMYEYSCWDGEDYDRLYDHVQKRCLHFTVAQCFEGATPPTMPPSTTSPVPTTTPPLTTRTTTTGAPLPIECPPEVIINIPYPGDCTKYVICVNGEAEEVRTCPNDQHFDIITGTCRHPSEATCYTPSTNVTTATTTMTTPTTTTTTMTTPTTTTTTMTTPTTTTTTRPTSANPTPSTGPTVITTTLGPGICPSTGILNIPHPYDCARYIFCVNSEGTEKWCETNLWFDVFELMCIPSSEATCAPDATLDPFPTTRPTTLAPTTNVATTVTSPPTTVTQPGTTQPTTRPTVGPPEECPDSGIVQIPHPTDCTKYIQCVHGERIEMSCPPGHKFDNPSRQCKPEAEAVCYNGF